MIHRVEFIQSCNVRFPKYISSRLPRAHPRTAFECVSAHSFFVLRFARSLLASVAIARCPPTITSRIDRYRCCRPTSIEIHLQFTSVGNFSMQSFACTFIRFFRFRSVSFTVFYSSVCPHGIALASMAEVKRVRN